MIFGIPQVIVTDVPERFNDLSCVNFTRHLIQTSVRSGLHDKSKILNNCGPALNILCGRVQDDTPLSVRQLSLKQIDCKLQKR